MEMPCLRRSAARLRLFIAFKGFFRSIGTWPDLLRAEAHQGNRKKTLLDDVTKIIRYTREGQKGIEKAGVVRHEDIGVLGVKTFLPLDMNPKSC